MCKSCNRKDFFICTDGDGKMPRLTRDRVPATPFYVQYVADKPVLVSPYFSQDRVWDYSRNEFLALAPNVKRYDGTLMPVYTGRIVEG